MKKTRNTSVAKMKKKAWAMFSKYVRLKYVTDGENEECYTCGNVQSWKKMQAGHGIAGRTNAILFLEDIVRPQDIQCNIFKNGALDVFTLKLQKEIGIERLEYIQSIKNTPMKLTLQDYTEIYEHYKRLVEDML